jgi:hypothetical protein
MLVIFKMFGCFFRIGKYILLFYERLYKEYMLKQGLIKILVLCPIQKQKLIDNQIFLYPSPKGKRLIINEVGINFSKCI